MAFVIGKRVTLSIEGGPYSGASWDVDSIEAMPIYYAALSAAAGIASADGAAAELEALSRLYDLVATIARPTWNLVDPKGPIPPTAAGMLRVPVPLLLTLVDLWTTTFEVPDAQ